jgi:hypothetical protein
MKCLIVAVAVHVNPRFQLMAPKLQPQKRVHNMNALWQPMMSALYRAKKLNAADTKWSRQMHGLIRRAAI